MSVIGRHLYGNDFTAWLYFPEPAPLMENKGSEPVVNVVSVRDGFYDAFVSH
jgi:hypothetical protein